MGTSTDAHGSLDTRGILDVEVFQNSYVHVEGKGLINSVTAVKLICRSEVPSQRTIASFLKQVTQPHIVPFYSSCELIGTCLKGF